MCRASSWGSVSLRSAADREMTQCTCGDATLVLPLSEPHCSVEWQSCKLINWFQQALSCALVPTFPHEHSAAQHSQEWLQPCTALCSHAQLLQPHTALCSHAQLLQPCSLHLACPQPQLHALVLPEQSEYLWAPCSREGSLWLLTTHLLLPAPAFINYSSFEYGDNICIF